MALSSSAGLESSATKATWGTVTWGCTLSEPRPDSPRRPAASSCPGEESEPFIAAIRSCREIRVKGFGLARGLGSREPTLFRTQLPWTPVREQAARPLALVPTADP